MVKSKIFLLIFLILILTLTLASRLALAESFSKNPLEWLAQLENEASGSSDQGGVFERLNSLEGLLTGKVRDDSLVNRLNYLDKLLYVNQPYDICLIYKVQALEWVLFRRAYSGSLNIRIENLEDSLYKHKFSGPLNQRIERLVSQVFPDGMVKSCWITVPEGLLIKVKTLSEISSVTNSAGDSFYYEVVNTVVKDHHVIFSQGITGIGSLKMVKRPGKLGNDARLILDFKGIRALDGTMVNLHYAAKTMDNNRTQQLVVGASTAGMLIFGPEGILVGLAIRGKEKSIPVGTEFYLQTRESVRLFTILE